jgi:hypothetical protein
MNRITIITSKLRVNTLLFISALILFQTPGMTASPGTFRVGVFILVIEYPRTGCNA